MVHRGPRIIFLIVFVAAAPLLAQQPQEDRTRELERKLDLLIQQSNALREEINALKTASPAAAASPVSAAQPQPPAASDEDLTKVSLIGAPPAAQQPPVATSRQANPASEQPQTALTDVQPVSNAASPGAGKSLNPDISVIGDFFGKAGRANPYEFGSSAMRDPLSMDEAEVAFQAFVDPYAKANFFLSASPEGLSIEEGYAQFVALPYGLSARAGRMKALFGKANTWHAHVRPWVDQPLVIHNFFTDEQLSDSGIEVSKMLENPYAFVEGTAEVFSGNNAVFHRRKQSDLFYDVHLKAFKDITENSNIEVGGSYARGSLPETSLSPGGSSQFTGIDVTYRWKPLMRGLYTSLIARFEGLTNDRADLEHRLNGFYASVDYQLAQRWFTGVRIDRADRGTAFDASPAVFTSTTRFTDRGLSATLTFWPSEFSQLRGQLRRTSYDGAKSINELLFQLQFAIGAHGAHTF
jgi:hypothetical protein